MKYTYTNISQKGRTTVKLEKAKAKKFIMYLMSCLKCMIVTLGYARV